MITPENITRLQPGEVFVFGSNLSGRHGKGAALVAAKKFGALRGQAWGPMGRCYAIATKDHQLQTLPLDDIREQVVNFLYYAKAHPHQRFLVTAIGCGLAGYSPKDIAPMFSDHPANVALPACFLLP